MSREFKFRVWVPRFNSFLNEYCGTEKIGVMKYGLFNSLHTLPYMPKNEYVIQQYTGLKDKNGVEIYEGDIVHYEFDGDTYPKEAVNKVLVCKWDQRQAWFVFDETLEEEWNGYYWLEIAKYSKVIGNIHENPELLHS